MKKTTTSKIQQNGMRRKIKDNFIGFGVLGLVVAGLLLSGDGEKGAGFLIGLMGIASMWIGYKIPLHTKVADVYERKGQVIRSKSGW